MPTAKGRAYDGVDAAFRRLTRKLGIKGASLHTLRHTFASHLVQQTGVIRAVQELLGHSDLHQTMVYAHTSSEQLHKQVAKLPTPKMSKKMSKDSELESGSVEKSFNYSELERVGAPGFEPVSTSSWSMYKGFRSPSTATATVSAYDSAWSCFSECARAFSMPTRKRSSTGTSSRRTCSWRFTTTKRFRRSSISASPRRQPSGSLKNTVFTELGHLIGTPEYMSPEQAEMSQQDVDTRTDVYALGVVLYELLVGALPFDARELRQAGLIEIHRRIREDEPSKPSTRVSGLGDASIAAAARRQTDPLALVGELRGDLDWITMKSLEKDRTRRYGSPAELAADLRRYLADEPVEATPPSATYRMRKFVRRHRIGVTAAATLVVLLIAFGASISLQAARIARERDRANREAETAQRVSQFMSGLFQVSNPSEAQGNAVTAREILDQGVASIRGDLDDQPLIQAQLLDTMGNVYSNLGLYEAALPLLERALSSRAELLGDDDPQTLTSKAHLVALHNERGRFETAEQLGEKVLASRQRVLGEQHPDTIESMRELALAYNGQARYGEAEDLLRSTAAASARVLGEGHPDTLRSILSLGALFQNQGRFDEAEVLTRDALEVARRTDGGDHPMTLTLAHNLASISISQGRYGEAETLVAQVLADRRRVLGEEHRYTLTSEYVLALSHFYRGQYDDVRGDPGAERREGSPLRGEHIAAASVEAGQLIGSVCCLRVVLAEHAELDLEGLPVEALGLVVAPLVPVQRSQGVYRPLGTKVVLA